MLVALTGSTCLIVVPVFPPLSALLLHHPMLQIGITEKYDLACLWSQNKEFKYGCSQGEVTYSFEALILVLFPPLY